MINIEIERTGALSDSRDIVLRELPGAADTDANININIKQTVEGLLMASDEPLSLDYLLKLLQKNGVVIEKEQLRETLNLLAQECLEQERAIELKEVASGYRFQVRSELAPWISRLWEEKPPRYSRAFLETLSIVVYKQPITRAEIEQVRGVSVSSNTIKTLLEHGWVKIVGYKEVPGKPALYATTNKFLDYFNLKSLEELPLLDVVEEIAPPPISIPTDSNSNVNE